MFGLDQYVLMDNINFEDNDFSIMVKTENDSVGISLEKGSKICHEEIELKYFYDGEAMLRIGNDIINVRAGDIALVNPYEIHLTVSVGETIGKYHLFVIGLDIFKGISGFDFDLRSMLLGNKLKFDNCISNHPYLKDKLDRIVMEMKEKKAFYKDVVKSLLLEFFVQMVRDGLYREQVNSEDQGTSRYYSILEPAFQKIHESYAEKLNVDSLAELCNISTGHFCRIFKLVTNKTLNQYLMDYRIQMAELLIKHTENSIAAIANYCGFMDESYFCKCYKKARGITPRKSILL